MHMRTTLNIDDRIMKQIRQEAARSGRTITQVIENLLRRGMMGGGPRGKKRRFRLEWVKVSGELLPGVDLSDRDVLYEIMEGRK